MSNSWYHVAIVFWNNVKTMGITYTNRRGQVYYLHQGTTKTGKPKYHFSQKDDGLLVEEVPAGYEVYENPNSQVFLRRIPKKIITDAEVAIAERGMKKYCKLPYFIIDVKKDILSIYTAGRGGGRMADMFSASGLFPQDRETLANRMAGYMNYVCDMRFVLLDKERRRFQTQRYCYLGSVDDWIDLGAPDQLEPLVKTYVRHIGQESMFDLRF